VLREDADVVLPHLAADVREHLVPVAQLDPEHRVGEGLHDGALHLDDAFLLRHVLRILCVVSSSTGWPANRPPAPRTSPVAWRWTSWDVRAPRPAENHR